MASRTDVQPTSPVQSVLWIEQRCRFRGGATPSLFLSFNQAATALCFLLNGIEHPDIRIWPIEHGNRAAAVINIAVHIHDFRPEQTVCLHSNLVGGAIVNAQRLRSAADVNTQRLPGERGLENALPQIASEKETIGPVTAQCRQKSQLCDTDVLRLIDHDKLERRMTALADLFSEPAEHLRARHLSLLPQTDP